MRLRPVGSKLFVVFPNDWEAKENLVRQNGLAGRPFRIDGVVVGVGPCVADIFTGDTVYGDPRTGRVLTVDDTMYHIMDRKDLVMKADYGI